jgi:hypothetical protein
LLLGGLGPRPIARDLRTGGPNGGIADGIDINVNATHALGLRVAIVFGFGLCPVFRFWGIHVYSSLKESRIRR